MLISADGFVLTAAHVVGDADTVDVVAHDGAGLRARVVRVSERQDVALLRVDGSEPFACLPSVPDDVPLGSDTFILGSPAGEELSFSVSKGIVSAYRDFDGTEFVQLDASVNPGNSGGPAVDASGHVIGIASWKVSHVSMEGLAFAVPIDIARRALGVEVATSSSENWESLRGRILVEGPQAPSAVPPRDANSRFNPKAIRRKRAKRALIVLGATSLGLGLIPLVTSAVLAREEHIDVGRWKALRVTNTIGWTTSLVGGGLLVVGIAVPNVRTAKAEVGFVPRANGASLVGRF